MNTPLPHGLIQVVSATRTEPSSDPVVVIYERKKALHNFWKVHDAQCRVSRDPTDIRCRQLFWRVWSDQRLSVSLSQEIILQLWMRCQRSYELTPFELRIAASSHSNETSNHLRRKASSDSDCSECIDSVSPSQLRSADETNYDDAGESPRSGNPGQRSKCAPKASQVRSPGILRTSSGDNSRKRASTSSTIIKTRTRPSINRKRSSQTTQNSDGSKPRKSIIKSPRTSFEEQTAGYVIQSPLSNLVERALIDPTDVPAFRDRKISAFELPPASSWLSVDSHYPNEKSAMQQTSLDTNALQIEGNFREKFVETQKILRSSTNLEAMNRTLRKTGSVVRFADDVDIPAELRKTKALSKDKEQALTNAASALRASSEGQISTSPGPGQASPWRPSNFQRHDSTGSVAAFSEDSEEEEDMMMLPRTRSQLSLGIANLRRSQSQGENNNAEDKDVAVASPIIEQVHGLMMTSVKTPTEEEEKLLAMGRKDGVTRAGGVNLPKELTVRGPRDPGDTFEEPEQALF